MRKSYIFVSKPYKYPFMAMVSKKYAAFISYNSHDDRWAKWLQKRLEAYRLPSVVMNEAGEVVYQKERKSGKFRVFRYVSDLVTTSLTSGLRLELDEAAYLIVICSPYSAKSDWVGKEIQYFASRNGRDKIIPFIVNGKPYGMGGEECLHSVLKGLFPDHDLLGVEVEEAGEDPRMFRRRKAVAKVVSLLIDVPGAFAFIWNRYRRQTIRKLSLTVAVLFFFLAALGGIRALSLPFDWRVSLLDTPRGNTALPGHGLIMATLHLPSDERTFYIGNETTVPNVPRRYLGTEVRFTAQAEGFLPLDTMLVMKRESTLGFIRDADYYGHVYFIVWDANKECPIPFFKVVVDGEEYVSDADGVIDYRLPLEKQKPFYTISCCRRLRENILRMPCNEYTAVLVE